MKLERLSLKSYRNIESSVFVPDPHLNFLVGNNAQGKTSVLEAIYYLATLRSFRNAKVQEMIQWSQTHSEIECDLVYIDEDQTWKTQLGIQFINSDLKRATKVASINGKAFKSSTQYLSHRFQFPGSGFHAIVFNPADHDLVRGEPRVRRNYLNLVISAEDHDYLQLLKNYNRILEQRNALLRSSPHPSQSLLKSFTEQLIETGAILTSLRLKWLSRLSERVPKELQEVAPTQEKLSVVYHSDWVHKNHENFNNHNNLSFVYFSGQGSLPSLEELKKALEEKFLKLANAEWRSQTTLVGPHRDDWFFLLGNQLLKGHGSQGEVRSTLLALKLSELELFQETTGVRPVFLLDDFSSELDRYRREFLLQKLVESRMQVFVTTTEDQSSWGKKYRVESGKILTSLSHPQMEVQASW